MYFPYGPSQQWLPVCHNKQPLPSIIYLPDPLSLHRYVWDIFHIQWRFGDGGGHQPVGLNAGIVYNSDPTSRISNYILICIQPNIWRLSREYISTFQSAEISASISAKCLSAKKSLHIVGLYKSPPSNLLNTAVFHLWKEFPLFTPEKFPTQKPIKRGGLIRLEEIGRGGEVGGAAKLPLKLCFKAGPCTTNNEDSYQDMRVLLALFGVRQTCRLTSLLTI